MFLGLNRKFIKSFVIIVGLIALAIFAVAETKTVKASTNPVVYFAAPAGPITQHSLFSIDVMLNTSKPINAVSIYVSYPADKIILRSIHTDGSLITIWRNMSPVSDNSGKVVFEGGTTDPFSGSAGKIGEIVFGADAQGIAKLTFSKADVYYADGSGTPAAVYSVPINLDIELQGATNFQPMSATAPPPEIADIGEAYNPVGGYSLATFRVIDRGTGVKSTQVRFLNWFSWSNWEDAMGPVPIPPTAWAFQVKVADSNGIISQKTVYLWNRLITAGIFLAAVAVTVFAGYSLYRRWHLKKAVI